MPQKKFNGSDTLKKLSPSGRFSVPRHPSKSGPGGTFTSGDPDTFSEPAEPSSGPAILRGKTVLQWLGGLVSTGFTCDSPDTVT
jgi:hypothetical protein